MSRMCPRYEILCIFVFLSPKRGALFRNLMHPYGKTYSQYGGFIQKHTQKRDVSKPINEMRMHRVSSQKVRKSDQTSSRDNLLYRNSNHHFKNQAESAFPDSHITRRVSAISIKDTFR